jgi:CelD/BcsL family acetyltransferase involved in cellulose biosynthesis
MYAIGVVTTEAGLAALWPAWQALWQRVPHAWPFTAPAWLHPWWRAFGTGCPVIAFAHDRLGLTGLLPLYRLGDKLLPMGVGCSDYFDALLAPEAPSDLSSRLLAAALEAVEAPRCDLPELPPNARLLCAETPPGWQDHTWDASPCPVLKLLPEPAIPKRTRRDLRQARHRAERAGGWCVEQADAARLPDLLDELVILHTRRWRSCGEPGVFADPQARFFHQQAAPLLLRQGVLRLQAIRLCGRIAAVNHALLMEGRICFYLAGFDPGAAFESPGTILLGHMLEEAAREGRSEAHFLRGNEAYKFSWGGVERRNTGRSFVRV